VTEASGFPGRADIETSKACLSRGTFASCWTCAASGWCGCWAAIALMKSREGAITLALSGHQTKAIEAYGNFGQRSCAPHKKCCAYVSDGS